MKKSKMRNQLRKIATRDAIEKRRNNRPIDPFAALTASTKRHNPVTNYQDYDDDEENYYGNST